MSLARLMSQPLTVQAMGPATQDVYGSWVVGELGPPVAVSGYLEQTSTVEFITPSEICRCCGFGYECCSGQRNHAWCCCADLAIIDSARWNSLSAKESKRDG